MKWPEKRTPYNNINGSQVIIQMKPQLPLIIKMTWINWLHRLLLSPPPSKQVSVMHGGSCRQIGDLRKGTCGCSRLPLALQGSQFITLGDAIPLLIVTILRKIEEGDKHSKNVKKRKGDEYICLPFPPFFMWRYIQFLHIKFSPVLPLPFWTSCFCCCRW